jgi:hypothetical protein
MTAQTALNRIIDNAKSGISSFDVYAKGSPEWIACQIGRSADGFATLHTRPDGQVFGIQQVEPGVFQSIVPSDLAEEGGGYLHSDIPDAAAYLQECALLRFVALAEDAQRMKHDDPFPAPLGDEAIKAVAAVNVEMNQLRQLLRNAGFSIPLTNDLSTADIAALKGAYSGSDVVSPKQQPVSAADLKAMRDALESTTLALSNLLNHPNGIDPQRVADIVSESFALVDRHDKAVEAASVDVSALDCQSGSEGGMPAKAERPTAAPGH